MIEDILRCSHASIAMQILLDIGGIAELTSVLHLVGLYYRTWRKATIIVKSVFFARLLGDAGDVWEANNNSLTLNYSPEAY